MMMVITSKIVNGKVITSSKSDMIPYNPIPQNDFIIPTDFKVPKSIKDLTPKQIEWSLALDEMLKARNLVVRAGI
ncbi:hypothetical protein LQZ19_02650, partial [Treponema primitia]|uniref:hypothetical protein n=1 Tax=Treponema primitia TaxID=88058 RepID=UPI0039804E6A